MFNEQKMYGTSQCIITNINKPYKNAKLQKLHHKYDLHTPTTVVQRCSSVTCEQTYSTKLVKLREPQLVDMTITVVPIVVVSIQFSKMSR
jgi:hypothetical protein